MKFQKIVRLAALFALQISLSHGYPDVLRCLECHEVTSPKACDDWVMCGQDEICYTREFRDRFGVKGYHLGCEDKAICGMFTNAHTLIGRQSTKRVASNMCFECCNSNDCNYIGCLNSTDCRDILTKNKSAPDGVYTIDPGDGQGPFQVFCDMTTDGGGWVVFQRRMDGSENFYRTWKEYQNGFGNLSHEFYLGNEKIHRLTSKGPTILRVDLEDFSHNKAYATYNNFDLGNVTSNYKLSIGAYDGTAGDSLTTHNGAGFTTKDKDVDSSSGNCAQTYHGAWWYTGCHSSNLNGQYNDINYGEGINWKAFKGYYYSLYHTEMKLRPQAQ